MADRELLASAVVELEHEKVGLTAIDARMSSELRHEPALSHHASSTIVASNAICPCLLSVVLLDFERTVSRYVKVRYAA